MYRVCMSTDSCGLKKILLAYTLFLLQGSVIGECQTPTVCNCDLAATSIKTASSYLSEVFSPNNSALDNVFNATYDNGTETILNGGAWQPEGNDGSPWFMIDFGSNKTIRKISTKGNAHYDYWVTKFNVFVKTEPSADFRFVKRLTGNQNGDGIRENKFNDRTQFSARYIKIVPVSFNGNVSLRIEFTGCDQVDGGWSSWSPWRHCRLPCGGGSKFRFHSCSEPAPKFLGTDCPGSEYDELQCNNHSCPPTLMRLELQLSAATWDNDLLTAPSSNPLCLDLQSNLSSVYVPSASFNVTILCTFFQVEAIKVGVYADLMISEPNDLFIVKLQDNLHYHQKIFQMPAVFRNYSSTLVPYPPSIIGYHKSGDGKSVWVERSAADIGPSTFGYEIFYRIETSDPDGEWSNHGPTKPNGACDTSSFCYIWSTKPFHNYTSRIIPFNEHGFGFGTQPYRVTASETKPSAPKDLTGQMNSSTSIRVTWSAVSLLDMNGNSEGYQIYFVRRHRNNWQFVRIVDHWTTEHNLTGLEEYVEYVIKIQSKNSKHYGSFSPTIIVRTDEDIPSSPPTNVVNMGISPTALRLHWLPVPESDRNGIIINYKINVSLGSTMKADGSFIVNVNNGYVFEYNIPNLLKWTYYTIQIAASTSKGTSAYSDAKTARTLEDKPDVAPGNLRGNAVSSTSIELLWNLIPLSSRHGVLTHYMVRYHPSDNAAIVAYSSFAGESTLQGTVTGLLYWTQYSFSISAKTSVGFGPYSGNIVIRTSEHAPTGSPINLAGHNTSSYSLHTTWGPVESHLRHGIVLGYNVRYSSMDDGSSQNIQLLGEKNVSVEIANLRNYTNYNITVAAYNSKGVGPLTWVIIQTEESEPSQSPASLFSYNTSSTSLWIEWSKIREESRRGMILGYHIIYNDIAYNISNNLTLHGENTLSFNLSGLEEFREYRISVAGFNKMGTGPFVSTRATTDEDIPSSPPVGISGSFVSSSEIRISWSQPPATDQNGELEAINVFFKMDLRTAPTRALNGKEYLRLLRSSNSSHATRRKRSLNEAGHGRCITKSIFEGLFPVKGQNAAVFSLLPSVAVDETYDGFLRFRNGRRRERRSTTSLSGFNTIILNANESSVSLNSLDPYMNYTIVLQAATAKGSGPLSQPILVETGESVPSAPPQNISANFTSSTSIVVNWQPVPYENSNGIVYAYIISVKRANSSEPWKNHIQYEPKLQYNITALLQYVMYAIKVTAVTSKGLGPFSNDIFATTDEGLPSAAPGDLNAQAVSPTLLRINWKNVPENGEPSCCLHGVLSGYKISYGKRYPITGDNITSLVLPPHQNSIYLGSLITYTPYTIDVAAITVKGVGPSARVHIWTSEARPIIEPQNVTIINQTSSSLRIEWNELPFLKRKGEIRGYAVYYKVTKSTHGLSVKWLDMYHFTRNYTVVYQPPFQVEIDDVIRRLSYELTELYKFMEYTIHLTAYTKKGTGPWTFAKHAMTDEDVPSQPAENVTARAMTSTSILIQWYPIEVIYDPTIADPVCCVNGNLTGYTIFYTREAKPALHNETIDMSYLQRIAMPALNVTNNNDTNATESSKMHYFLKGLDPFKNYTIYVAGNTRKGHGVLGKPVHVVTKQDVPAREPSAVRSWNSSSTSLHVEWDEIPWEYRNGIILYYTIYYRESKKPWQSLNVSAEFNSTKIRNLKKWTSYDIRIYGATVRGQGLISANITVQTDSDVPTMPPQNITAVDYTGPYSILLKWKPIPPEHRHGVILSYKIIFHKYSEADQRLKNTKEKVIVVPSSKNEVYLEYLSTFCTYSIKILGMTNQGDGIHSKEIFAKTCRCVKHIYTNWWPFHPYIYEVGIQGEKPTIGLVSNLSYIPQGIFGQFVKDMVVWGCQNCNGPRGHGLSVVHFDIGRSNGRSMKNKLADCVRDANDTVDLTFPLQGRLNQRDFLTEGKFLQLVDSPNSALIVLKKLKIISKSLAMRSAIFSIWPVAVMIMLLAFLAGLIFWLLDASSNQEELPSSVFKGMWTGLWWAYVTMTTVGYGDITPRSYAAKVFSVMWILVGLVVFAIFGSSLTSALFVQEEVISRNVQIYNNKIAVVQSSFEEQLVLRKVGKPVARKTVAEVLEMVKNDQIEGALVDSFVLSLYKDIFKNSSFFVQKTYKSSYSYGIGLTGNITKLDAVFTDFIHSNQKQFVESIEKYVLVFKSDEASAVVKGEDEDSDSLFQSSSPLYRNTVYIISVMIGFLFILGTLFMVCQRKSATKSKERNRNIEHAEALVTMAESFEDMNELMENFVTSLKEKLDIVDIKQNEERQRLINIHRFLGRCKRHGVDPTHELRQHEIFIKNWDRVDREGKKIEIFATKSIFNSF